MSWKTWAPLVIAIGLGLAAALAAKNMITRQHTPAGPVGTQPVVVASRDLGPGQMLQQGDLVMGSMPANAAANGTFTNFTDLLGRVVTTRVDKGQAIVMPLLAPVGDGGGLQSLIPKGMRAVTLEVNEFSGVGGLLIPGCRVDVLATLRSDPGHEAVTRTIAQDLKVTAVGQSMGMRNDPPQDNKSDPRLPRSVTLLASPKQAELIQLASDNGRPWLVLRGGKDNAPVAAPGVTLAELRGKPANADNGSKPVPVVQVQMPMAAPTTRPVEAQAEPDAKIRRTVQLIRGSSESQVIFEMPAKMAVSSVAE